MNSAELFLYFVRRLIFAFFVVVLVSTARAQNAGNVGIYTREIAVFNAQSTSKSSGIFPDFGFGANYLTYCDTNFIGVIDLEWSPPITGSPTLGPFISLAQASYTSGNADSACHTLQVGGYYPNLRSTLTITGGSVSAWYTASSAPISYVPSGLGTNGPTPPIVCDVDNQISIPTGTTVLIAGPLNSGDRVILCGFTVSFNGATSTGNVEIAWSATNACGTLTSPSWAMFTTSATPQTLSSDVQQRTNFPVGDPYACVTNSSGATVFLSASYASVHGL